MSKSSIGEILVEIMAIKSGQPLINQYHDVTSGPYFNASSHVLGSFRGHH